MREDTTNGFVAMIAATDAPAAPSGPARIGADQKYWRSSPMAVTLPRVSAEFAQDPGRTICSSTQVLPAAVCPAASRADGMASRTAASARSGRCDGKATYRNAAARSFVSRVCSRARGSPSRTSCCAASTMAL